jgi:hypothetical protein
MPKQIDWKIKFYVTIYGKMNTKSIDIDGTKPIK